jgi:hypothetical protein
VEGRSEKDGMGWDGQNKRMTKSEKRVASLGFAWSLQGSRVTSTLEDQQLCLVVTAESCHNNRPDYKSQ